MSSAIAAPSLFSPPPFRCNPWLLSGHLETIASVFSRSPAVSWEREIISTRDHDQLALDFSCGAPDKPLLVLLHGLEGCSQSRAMRVLAHGFMARGWTVAAPHFRGCGGRDNLLPRAYHAADADEVEWMIAYCRARFLHRQVFAAGVSLGGCALMHYLAKNTFGAAAAVISAPFDLTACVRRMDSGLNRQIYAAYFLRSLRRKILAKSRRFPAVCDARRMRRIRTIGEFDDLYTAPVHGFDSAAHYWREGSPARLLPRIESPLLCINALNDPIIPAHTLPAENGGAPAVRHVRPKRGGHGAFIGAPADWLFQTVHGFFCEFGMAAPAASVSTAKTPKTRAAATPAQKPAPKLGGKKGRRRGVSSKKTTEKKP